MGVVNVLFAYSSATFHGPGQAADVSSDLPSDGDPMSIIPTIRVTWVIRTSGLSSGLQGRKPVANGRVRNAKLSKSERVKNKRNG